MVGMGRSVRRSKDPGIVADCTTACRNGGSAGRIDVAIVWYSVEKRNPSVPSQLDSWRAQDAALYFSL